MESGAMIETRSLTKRIACVLETITWILKVERCLGLDEEIKDDKKKHFAKEDHLVPERFLKESKKFKTGEDFINDKLTICDHTII